MMHPQQKFGVKLLDMACIHRFADWLQLDPDIVNWKVNTLIVGTFNPGWQCNNNASWFYGRTNNNYLWSILPSVYGEHSLRLQNNNQAWLNFCKTKSIAFTDLIGVILDANEINTQHQQLICGKNFSDKIIENNFKKFIWISIIQILIDNPTIKNIHLTRSANNGLWKQQWIPIESYCNNNGLHCRTLLTPSGNARFQFNKGMQKQYGTLENFILNEWKAVWHPI